LDTSRHPSGIALVERFIPTFLQNCSWDQRRLDSSESYSARAIVPQNIRTLYEQYGLDKNRIKFIMVIRDPLERAYAWYNFGVGINLPGFNVTFEEKIEEEVGRISECQNYAKSHGITDETNVWAHCSKIFLNYDGSTVFPGMMASALKYWFRFFDPAQFLILPLNEYRDNFSDVKKRIAQHLNLKDDSVFEQEHSDHGRKPYVLPKMPQKLIDHFYNEREQMAELVQKTPHSFFRVLEQPSFLALQNVNISRSGRHPKQLSHQQGILDMYTNS